MKKKKPTTPIIPGSILHETGTTKTGGRKIGAENRARGLHISAQWDGLIAEKGFAEKTILIFLSDLDQKEREG
jgi:hypothetical protein